MKESFDTDLIEKSIEETPYMDSASNSLFHEWCEVNDSICPIFLDRDKWKGRENIFEKIESDEGPPSHFLYIPKDLNLWEMINIANIVDRDTYKGNHEVPEERVRKIEELSKTFKKAGVYINENIGHIEEGKDLAEKMAKRFFNYGLTLESRTKKEQETISGVSLNEQDRTELDKWFLGEERYEKVISRLGSNPSKEQIEGERKRHFKGYFKALSMQGYEGDGEKPWERERGPINRIHKSTEAGIKQAIETPRKELEESIFDRGLNKLLKEMKIIGREEFKMDITMEDFDSNLSEERKKLYNSLEIPRLKNELETLRKTGSVKKIAEKELEIAKKIQRRVSSYSYVSGLNNPSDIVKRRTFNCLGSSLLGGSLLDDLGIKYFVVDLPRHSTTLLMTSTNELYWQDFTPQFSKSQNFTNITPKMIEEPDSVRDFLLNPKNEGVSVRIPQWNPYSKGTEPLEFYLMKPELGLPSHLLYNLAKNFCEVNKDYRRGISTIELLLRINPDYYPAYDILGDAYSALNRNLESKEAYQKAIEMNPDYSEPYLGFGDLLLREDNYEEALKTYIKFISINKKRTSVYYNLGTALEGLGRNSEAISAYRNFVSYWKGDKYWYDKAMERLEQLEAESIF